MMKLGVLFELSHCRMTDSHFDMFKTKGIELPAKNLYLHQCSDPDYSNWEWGIKTLNIVEGEMIDAGTRMTRALLYETS